MCTPDNPCCGVLRAVYRSEGRVIYQCGNGHSHVEGPPAPSLEKPAPPTCTTHNAPLPCAECKVFWKQPSLPDAIAAEPDDNPYTERRRRKLTDEQSAQISSSKETAEVLANRFGVSRSTIWHYRRMSR